MTVLFCDLVGSTTLSGELDPEDFHGLLRAYQETAATAVESFEGYIAQYLGDGLLIYFGYPAAHEDDAVRAVHAGLQILRGLDELNQRLDRHGSERLEARIGIHTGNVVAGEVGAGQRREQLAMGQTPNLAARLQGLAKPGNVVLSEATYRLAQGFFNFEPLGPQSLKGIPEPVAVYQVLEESGIHGRFELALRRGLAPLVGRRTELELLIEKMHGSRAGRGWAVLVSGEAGIGKSRLVHSFREEVRNEVSSWWVYRCSPFTRNTSFYPVIELIHEQLRLEPDDTPDVKIAKLEERCEAFGLELDEMVPLIAALISLNLEGRYPPLADHPQLFKEKVLEFFVSFILNRAHEQPVIFFMEDLHWVDPSTLEFLDRLIEQSRDVRLLLLFTSRPEFKSPWCERPHFTHLHLERFSASQTDALIDQFTGSRQLPYALRQHLLEKSDGVPLYIEEMTKSLIESDFLTVHGDRYELTSEAGPLAIPATLRDSLTARLDRLGSAKEVAQLGGAVGREFSYDVLAAVTNKREHLLRRELARLVEAELLYERFEGSQTIYSFKHALVQDAAYLSLLKSQRQAIHERIARTLEERFPTTRETEPERLAHHYQEARQFDEAARFLLQAGRQATQSSAYSEAVNHCRRGISLLEGLTKDRKRQERELELRSTLGVGLIATLGYASDEVEENYARSREICRELGSTPQLVPSLYGLWVYHLLRGHRQSTIELAEQIHRGAEDETTQQLIAHSARGATELYRGHFEEAKALTAAAKKFYRPELHPKLAQTFGDDSGLLPHFYHYWCCWIRGEADTAIAHKDRVTGIVEELSSPYVQATGLLFEMILWHELRELEKVESVAERFVALASEQRFPFFLALARVGHGWTLAHRGEVERSLAEMHEALATHAAIGTRLPRSYWLTYLIEVLLTCGRTREGLEVVDEALELSQSQLDVFYDAELHRLRGDLLVQIPEHGEAEAAYRQALDVARQAGAKAFALRAATSLALLLRHQERGEEARPLLGEIYGSFEEGLDRHDPRQARDLLDQLTVSV